MYHHNHMIRTYTRDLFFILLIHRRHCDDDDDDDAFIFSSEELIATTPSGEILGLLCHGWTLLLRLGNLLLWLGKHLCTHSEVYSVITSACGEWSKKRWSQSPMRGNPPEEVLGGDADILLQRVRRMTPEERRGVGEGNIHLAGAEDEDCK